MEWDTAQSLPDAFHEVPLAVYRDDPWWIAENPAQLAWKFSRANPYFNNNKAWLDCVPGIARLAGFYNPSLKIDGVPVAFFGYWETQQNLPVNRRLFQALERWAAHQGARKLYGPINFSTFDHYRLRLDTFEKGAFPAEPYNPPYYPELMTRLGYRINAKYLSVFDTLDNGLRRLRGPVGKISPRLAKVGVRLEPLTPAYWQDNLPLLHRQIDRIFSDNFAYTPIDYAAFAKFYNDDFTARLAPCSQVALDRNNQLVGFVLAIPDYGPLLRRQVTGNRQRIAYHTHAPLLSTPCLLIKSLGVASNYRHKGLLYAMSYQACCKARHLFDYVGVVLMHDDNLRAKGALNILPAGKRRHYGLYCRTLSLE